MLVFCDESVMRWLACLGAAGPAHCRPPQGTRAGALRCVSSRLVPCTDGRNRPVGTCKQAAANHSLERLFLIWYNPVPQHVSGCFTSDLNVGLWRLYLALHSESLFFLLLLTRSARQAWSLTAPIRLFKFFNRTTRAVMQAL